MDCLVRNVTSFLSKHPGGELDILTFAGKGATGQFNRIHPPEVVGGDGITLEEVAKRPTKSDCRAAVGGLASGCSLQTAPLVPGRRRRR